EIFLFDLNTENGKFELSNFKNISNNDGYDNQPSFLDDNTILFASTRNGQTDIAKYNINYDSKIFINHTEGSEYSPLKIPKLNAVSAIRLDKDGTQLLYNYNLSNGESEILIENLIIGYHSWYNENLLISSVLEDGGLSLYVTNFEDRENYKFDDKIGRSLHKIPKTELASYISKKNDSIWEIKSLNLISGKIKSIMTTLPEAEDVCWLPNGTMLMGKEDILYSYNPNKDVDWVEVASLKDYGITNITRLTVNSNGTKLALVGEGGRKEIIDPNKKLEPKLENIAWIAGNWKGEAFGGLTEENWSLPSGGSMMATFKLVKDDNVVFYEIEIIREVNNTLILQLKHFNNDLKGWESKDDTVDFPLKEITPTKVIFEGMTFEKITDNEMNVYVDIHNDNGTIETIKFKYIKK
ncbi:MAG: PD40 domain-containing protein, partial [Bacteroidetes bacterium]|nr:PD40 domain-containing protein [Bacteroidota bacterium]